MSSASERAIRRLSGSVFYASVASSFYSPNLSPLLDPERGLPPWLLLPQLLPFRLRLSLPMPLVVSLPPLPFRWTLGIFFTTFPYNAAASTFDDAEGGLLSSATLMLSRSTSRELLELSVRLTTTLLRSSLKEDAVDLREPISDDVK